FLVVGKLLRDLAEPVLRVLDSVLIGRELPPFLCRDNFVHLDDSGIKAPSASAPRAAAASSWRWGLKRAFQNSTGAMARYACTRSVLVGLCGMSYAPGMRWRREKMGSSIVASVACDGGNQGHVYG